MIKLDAHTRGAYRGRVTKLAMCVYLKKPLVSKTRINGRLQQVKYEGLPNICFKCGLFGHSSESYLKGVDSVDVVDNSFKHVLKESGILQ